MSDVASIIDTANEEAFGHTSGWDALAGMAMTLRWFLTAQQRD